MNEQLLTALRGNATVMFYVKRYEAQKRKTAELYRLYENAQVRAPGLADTYRRRYYAALLACNDALARMNQAVSQAAPLFSQAAAA